MEEPCILIVEGDILVRHPLAEYLRECGYKVLEASDTDEARRLLTEGPSSIDVVLVDVQPPRENGFALAGWIRANHPDIDVVMAATVEKAAEKAGDLCHEGPVITKPYDHKIVLQHIRRLLASRRRGGGPET